VNLPPETKTRRLAGVSWNAPDRIRTCDLRFRRPLRDRDGFFPASERNELRGDLVCYGGAVIHHELVRLAKDTRTEEEQVSEEIRKERIEAESDTSS
jgi:hypothetical protein